MGAYADFVHEYGDTQLLRLIISATVARLIGLGVTTEEELLRVGFLTQDEMADDQGGEDE